MPPGSTDFLLGSDALGRNVAAAIAYGAVVSLMIGCISTAVSLGVGISLGAVSVMLAGGLMTSS